MAFTGQELFRGAIAAWIMSVLIMSPLILVLPATGISLAAATLLTVTFVGMPLAFAIGYALRRIASMTVHFFVFGALGALSGMGMGMVLYSSGAGELLNTTPLDLSLYLPYLLVPTVVATICSPFGWHYTMRRALLADQFAALQSAQRDQGDKPDDSGFSPEN